MKNITYLLSVIILYVFAGTVLAAPKILPTCISKNYGNNTISADRIQLNAPDIAEDGSVVGIGIRKIEGLKAGEFVKELSFYNEFRKEPIATFILSKNTRSDNLKTRFRLRESSHIYAVARLDSGEIIGGQSYVKVTIGGCGGGGSLNALGQAPRICNSK